MAHSAPLRRIPGSTPDKACAAPPLPRAVLHSSIASSMPTRLSDAVPYDNITNLRHK